MNFVVNKIGEGEKNTASLLAEGRIKRALSLEEAAQKLGINKKYLEKMEKNEFSELPPGFYKKTILKKYAAFLGLDAEKIAKNFEKEKPFLKEKNKKFFLKKTLKEKQFLIFPKIFKNLLIIMAIFAFLIYILFSLRASFSPPDIKIFEPMDNLTTEAGFVYVAGQTSPANQIFINGQAAPKDGAGIFKEKINLKKGLNTITITAQNKYGKKNSINKQILVK